MSLLRTFGFLFLYYITMSKLGTEFDTLESILIGVAAAPLFSRDKKEK